MNLRVRQVAEKVVDLLVELAARGTVAGAKNAEELLGDIKPLRIGRVEKLRHDLIAGIADTDHFAGEHEFRTRGEPSWTMPSWRNRSTRPVSRQHRPVTGIASLFEDMRGTRRIHAAHAAVGDADHHGVGMGTLNGGVDARGLRGLDLKGDAALIIIAAGTDPGRGAAEHRHVDGRRPLPGLDPRPGGPIAMAVA